MLTRSVRLTALFIPVVVLPACLDDSVGVPRNLEVSLVADQSVVTLGDSAVVRVSAQGRHLTDITLLWGDGTVRERDALGAVEFESRETHMYQDEGTYEVHVRVIEFAGATAEASTTVQVVGPEGP